MTLVIIAPTNCSMLTQRSARSFQSHDGHEISRASAAPSPRRVGNSVPVRLKLPVSILECSVRSHDEKDECSCYLDLREFVGKALRYALLGHENLHENGEKEPLIW